MDSILKGHAGKWIRRCVLFILDLCLIYLSLRVAILMRYENHVSAGTLKNIYSAVPQLLLVFGACSVVGGVYDMIWRYAGAAEFARLAVVYLISTAAILALNRLAAWRISRPILAMTGVIALLAVAVSRFSWKLLREFLRARQNADGSARILIVGAGEGGVYAARICQQNQKVFGHPVAFADDDPLKRRMRIGGIPVCGTIDEVPQIVEKMEIDEIIVAVPSTKGDRLAEIVAVCKGTRCRTRILSNPGDVGASRGPAFRELNTSDFLSREEVALDMELIRGYLAGKVVLVTGGVAPSARKSAARSCAFRRSCC